MGICQQSEEEVRKIVAQFRDIEAAKGVTREGVEAVKTVLIKLAKKKIHFPSLISLLIPIPMAMVIFIA